MSFVIVLFIVSAVLFSYIGINLYHQYKKSSGIFFLFFSLGLSIWIITTSASYEITFHSSLLLFLDRISYWLSTTFFISFCLFFSLFNSSKERVKKYMYAFIILITILFYTYIFTDLVVSRVEIDRETGIYNEIYGSLFFYLQWFYYLTPFVLAFFSYRTIRKQDYITKIRLSIITLGFVFTTVISIAFLVIFPILDFYYYEGQIIYFFIPFIIGIIYSSRTYVFSSFKGILSKIYIFCIPILLSAGGVIGIKNMAPMLGLSRDGSFSLETIGFYEVGLYSFLFLVGFKYMERRVKIGDSFTISLENIQKEIPFTTTIEDLNYLLKGEFKKYFGIKNFEVVYDKNISKTQKILSQYFKTQHKREFFLNDKIFIEENLSDFDKKNIVTQIPKDTYIIIPIYRKEVFIGYIRFGKKSFSSYYSREEVESLLKFVRFVEGHLKYIDIYDEIHDLNLNLEKRVDDKTIEYNAIINHQKEFIEVVSHEIRTPLATALFQTECIEYELKEQTFKKKRSIISDVKALYNKITDTVDLVNKLFSIERIESNKVQLYKESVDLGKMLKSKIQLYAKTHREIEFLYEQHTTIGPLDIDLVQFKQVIDNLITNSIKFSGKVSNPKILVKLVKRKKDIIFTIEDSGLGFSGIDISTLFNKYNTGNSSSIGLGMGLYLCKKIVELHGGNISAGKSKKLGGALFKIVLREK